MRLVDADALKEDCRMANDCKDCKTSARDCEYDYIYTKRDFCGWIDDAPSVDAIPMDDVFALAIALNKGIEELGLSVRAYHALSRWACHTVGDVYRLLKSGEIKKVRNLGDKSIGEIEDRLCAYLPYLWRAEGR